MNKSWKSYYFSKEEDSTPANTSSNLPVEGIFFIDTSSLFEEAQPDPCEQYREQLAATHPDDLTIAERIELDTHIKTCPSCASIQRMDCILDEMVRHLPFRNSLPSETQLEVPSQLQRMWEFRDKHQQEQLSQPKSEPALTNTLPSEHVPEDQYSPTPVIAPRAAQKERTKAKFVAFSLSGRQILETFRSFLDMLFRGKRP